MGDERWLDIFNRPPRDSRPAVAPLAVPRVRAPKCEEHCSGRHEHDGIMQCPNCRVPAYRIIAHEWAHQDGHYFHSLEPMNGFAIQEKSPKCNCGREMVRAV